MTDLLRIAHPQNCPPIWQFQGGIGIDGGLGDIDIDDIDIDIDIGELEWKMLLLLEVENDVN